MERGADVVVIDRVLGNVPNDDYVRILAENGYRIARVPLGANPGSAIESARPLLACFQYDYPDLPGLAELRLTKAEIPSIPLVMVTQTHSESLAVWAFRAGVRDYFVHPVDVERLLALLQALATYSGHWPEGRAGSRYTLQLPSPIPREARIRPTERRSQSDLLTAGLTYIDDNLDQRIRQAEIAELCGLSPFQFSRAFKRELGVTFQEYLVRKRIAAAMRMLCHPGASVTDVCYTVGFSDLSYFTRTFQRYAGETPSAYRRRAMHQALPASAADRGSSGEDEALPATDRQLHFPGLEPPDGDQ